ncbi:MAG: hypothetical protein BWX57_00545 [Tenericutes bacterium ADurb.Bin024]|nr:MAG: hypothetical protein BWX57_00545 [Tenericutes bacterium ADurb.Bin024]
MIQTLFLADTNWYFGLWLGIFVLAIIIEAAEPGLVSIWFAGGALVAFILSLFPDIPLWVQILAFIGTSGVLLLLSFIFFRKSFLNAKSVQTNVDALLEEEVILLYSCDKDTLGEVKYRDVIWKVTPKDYDAIFTKGETAIVDAIKGNRLVIKKKGTKK